MSKLTYQGLKALKVGSWASDHGPRGGGALAARKLQSGSVLFYFRYTNSEGSREAIPLGEWDGTGGALSLTDARDLFNKHSARYRAGARDLRDVLDAEGREAKRQRDAKAQAAEAAKVRQKATLGVLLMAYVAQLRKAGKASAKAVERSFTRNVQKAWPKLWDVPAADVTLDDLVSVVAQLANANKLREADKLRSYFRSAYSSAVQARQDARASEELRALSMTANPARDLMPIKGASQARKRALSLSEIRAYWRRIVAMPGVDGALLRFHLLTGGQRIEQLGRLTIADYDKDSHAVCLHDRKGRRVEAREHVIPLTAAATDALESMGGGTLGEYLYTVTGGASGAVYATVQTRLRNVVTAMAGASELEKGEFTVGDLRRSVETQLAAKGVSQEVRAQLQSHGLSGVQARHYDRHDYMSEKLEALEVLYRVLTEEGGDGRVLRFRSKAK